MQHALLVSIVKDLGKSPAQHARIGLSNLSPELPGIVLPEQLLVRPLREGAHSAPLAVQPMQRREVSIEGQHGGPLAPRRATSTE
eukprot:1421753-Lingulodinium_polyedra.AAC.1